MRDRLWRPTHVYRYQRCPPHTAEAAVTDCLIRTATALAVIAVACVAAIISYQHAYELVSTHGEHGLTAGSCRSRWTA